MSGEAAEFTTSDRALVAVVVLEAVSAFALAGLVVHLIATSAVTSAMTGAILPFAALLGGTAIGLLQLTTPFDARHPDFARALTHRLRAVARHRLGVD
ncbi:hypothetical protein EAH79_11700 [Sphingomonas koreensis]|nr:hypothetical protein EAH79_11700 [Sphingomonas koreensis]